MEYVESFNRNGIELCGVDDKLMWFTFENNLCDNWKFKEELGFSEPKNMSDILVHTQPFINYEEKLLEEVHEEQATLEGDDSKHRDDDEKEKRKGYRSSFSEYTPLNTSRERILQKCASA